ncbi:MAG: hypothetical protein VXW22_02325 [Pseudomonadota bacterium]|nr:hypothetical protein [Pseudomonadota bacterium]
MSETEPQPPQIDREAFLKAQKRRNMWLGWALFAFVVIVGVTTAIRLQQSDFGGSDRLYFSGYLDEAAKEKRDREAEERADAAAESAPPAEETGDE